MLAKPAPLVIDSRDPFANDVLDRKRAADSLTSLVESFSQPAVLAISGRYGTGKTTFLRMWMGSLQQRGHHCVYFDAWKTDFSSDPLIALTGELDASLSGQLPPGPKRTARAKARKLKQFTINIAKKAVPLLVRSATAGVASLSANDLADALADHLADAAESLVKDQLDQYEASKRTVESFSRTLEELAQAVGDPAQSLRAPMVVFVDELDRCRPTFAIELLEKVKHLFSVPGVVFVLGVDREQLGHSLRAVYGEGIDADGYLRRMIDLSYELPEPSPHRFVERLLETLGIEEALARRPDSGRCLQAIEETCKHLIPLFALPMRVLEQCFAELNVALRTIPNTSIVNTPFLTFLLLFRAKNPVLYRRYATGSARAKDVVAWLHGLPGATPLFEEEHYGLYLDVSIYALSCTKEDWDGEQSWSETAHDSREIGRRSTKLNILKSYQSQYRNYLADYHRRLTFAADLVV